MELGDDITPFDLNYIYIHGLQPDVMKEVDMNIAMHEAPLSDVMAKASIVEARLRDLATIMGPVTHRPFNSFNGHSSARNFQQHPARNDPMELGMIRRHKGNHGKPPFLGNCYNCGASGHRSDDCPAPPLKQKPIQQPARNRRR